MQLLTLFLGVVLPAAFAKVLKPPPYFLLKAESTSSNPNGTYEGTYIRSVQVSNTQAVAVMAPAMIPATFLSLTQPNTTASPELYSLFLQPASKNGGFLTPLVDTQAFWEPMYFTYTSDKATPQQTVFYVTGTKQAMYLQMEREPIFTNSSVTALGFQGFLICYWSTELPQLFFRTAYGSNEESVLPPNCGSYNLRVIPISK